MINILYVGDPHFKHTQKDEMERLMSFVQEVANLYKIDQIVILGDLNDTHGILRTDNQVFWDDWLFKLSENHKLVVLIGNHDKKNQGDDYNLENSLSVYDKTYPNMNLVQVPMINGLYGYMPYFHNKENFVIEANKLAAQGAKVLVCHAEFEGGAYDNGFFIPDGIRQEDLNFNLIISGHIHSRATIGKIRYPGTARWMTASDANKEKGLWLVTHDDATGAILNEEFLDTSHVCTPIYAYQFKEGDKEPIIPEGSRASVELTGSSEWVSKEKARFKGKASISVKITDKEKPKNRKTGNNLSHFINNVFEPTNGIKKEKILEFMRELNIL